jgi:hypothetical protein
MCQLAAHMKVTDRCPRLKQPALRLPSSIFWLEFIVQLSPGRQHRSVDFVRLFGTAKLVQRLGLWSYLDSPFPY